jgi:hypothetical protein
MRRLLIAFGALAVASLAVAAEPALPLRSGRYAFQHRFAEQPEMPSIPLLARISGHHIVLINRTPSAVFPKGVIAEGTLMWHARSGQWIIGDKASDRDAEEAGGCSDGPEVVDLVRLIYWTC